MSLRVGLGASQADLDVQGEIDFDFFEGSDSSAAAQQPISTHKADLVVTASAKPTIIVSSEGAVQIEAVIPSPFAYKESKTKTPTPSGSDDSSISSMSESESSVSPDSFEDSEDSMTDVSPLVSPAKQPESSGETNQPASSGEPHLPGQPCEKCGSLDLRELVSAMKRLKMKQSRDLCSLRCKSPIVTQNAKTRKNLSFTNEEVRRIDNENRALLKKILAQQNRPSSKESCSVQVRASSAVNRQRQQRQIELENLAFLKRLEATKASQNLSRTKLLHEYEGRSSCLLSRTSRVSSRASSGCSSVRSSTSIDGRSSSKPPT